ncbi:hypothetical protein BGW39_009003 [Mortierella sp. 14UC]|nr:hypothetical protein BGW39_009003 [Mortierella sp. 14UC]
MSASNNNSTPGTGREGAVSDHALAERLAKLKETGANAIPSSDQDLALHFSKVFGHSPAATHLSPPLPQDGSQYQWNNGNSNKDGNTLGIGGGSILTDVVGSAASQKSMSSYFIPKDSSIDQDEIDKILADSEDLLVNGNNQDDLDFLDDLEDTLSPSQRQELKTTINPNTKAGDERALEDVAKDLEKTLSKFLQTHQPPATAFHNDHHSQSAAPQDYQEGAESKQERAFGEHLDRLAGVPLSTDKYGAGGDDDEASRLITQLREESQLESKYGNLDEARMKDLHSRSEDLKKGIQSLSSVRSNASKASSTDDGLGPPPAAVGLDELRGVDDDENPDNWCCMCNEDATWTCPGCDDDNYCEECFRESHIGPEADWEMKKHRPRPFVKASAK